MNKFISSHWIKYQDTKEGLGDFKRKNPIYRFECWLTIFIYLLILPRKIKTIRMMFTGLLVCRKMGIIFNYDAFRQVCALVFLDKYIRKFMYKNIVNIGDGYGFLSALIKEVYPEAEVTLVDILSTLNIQYFNLSKYNGQRGFNFIFPEGFAEYQKDFNIAINIASFQEMNNETVEYYFKNLRKKLSKENIFYTCNRVRKQMPGGEVAELANYPWSNLDINICDEICPWYRFFISHNKSKRQIFPMVQSFDGDIFHKLVILSKDNN